MSGANFIKHTGRELLAEGYFAYVWHDAPKSPYKKLSFCFFSDKDEADCYARALSELFGYSNPENLYPFPSPCFRSYWIGEYGNYRLALNPLMPDGKPFPSPTELIGALHDDA